MFCGLESGEFKLACFSFFPSIYKAVSSHHIFDRWWTQKDQQPKLAGCKGPNHMKHRWVWLLLWSHTYHCKHLAVSREQGGKVLRGCDKARFLRTKQSRRLLSEQHSYVYANKSRWTFQNRFEWSLACDSVFFVHPNFLKHESAWGCPCSCEWWNHAEKVYVL